MGRNWNTPEEIEKDSLIFLKMLHAMAGLYYWEFVTSLDFEWKFISRKRRFHWTMIFYFGARYCMLTTLTALVVALSVTTPINCQVLYTTGGTTGQATAGFVSLILGVRTMAIYEMRWYIVIPIVLCSMGQWAILLQGGIFTGHWDQAQGCIFAPAHRQAQLATLIYSLIFDFMITALATYKLTRGPARTSRVANLLFKDGLIYYLVALTANVPAVVMMAIKLNPVLSIMLNPPASVIYVTAACRAVRRLANFQSIVPGVYTPNPSPGSSSAQTKVGIRPPIKYGRCPQESQAGIQVQMKPLQTTDAESDCESKDVIDINAENSV